MSRNDSSQFEIARDSPPPTPLSGDLAHQLADLHLDAWGWALAISGSDPGEAEEVLQLAYLRILDGRARFGGRSQFKTWVFGVIRNVARERRRSARATSPAAMNGTTSGASHIVDPGPGPGESLARSRVSSRLRRGIARLSRRQQQILHLVFYQEMTIAEAAEVLGISAGSGRTHYERGKARLRELLEDAGEEA